MARKHSSGHVKSRTARERNAPDKAAAAGLIWPAYASAIALWASFPPLSLSVLAWLAPLGWLAIGERPTPLRKRDWWHLWLSGCLFWLAILQGIRLAYWPLYLGWVALSLYLAIYIPIFVGLYRLLRRRGWPSPLAAPVVWVGLEFLRSYALTGYAANMLGHSQARWPLLIQIADSLGVYGLSFLIMTVCASFYRLLRDVQQRQAREAALSSGLIACLLVATLGYGSFRLSEAQSLQGQQEPKLRVLLVQENTPTMFDSDLATIQLAWTRYVDTTRALVSKHGPPDLVVWPESTFTGGTPWVDSNLPNSLPAELQEGGVDLPFLRDRMRRLGRDFAFKSQQLLDAVSATPADSPSDTAAGPHFLLGSDAMEIRDDAIRRFNSALFLNPAGAYVDRYDKVHLVMFGEYIPLGPLLQWLRDLFGLPGATPGSGPKCFTIGNVCVSPNICFESMLPRIIRGQVAELVRRDSAPDILVNVTNDSWFRGSSMLDHHLACSILCAVENRRPLLVAANTGISAEIDSSGRVLQSLERGEVGGLLAEPRTDARWGPVQSFGYPLGWLSAAACCLSLVQAWWVRQRRRPSPPAGKESA